MEYDWLMTRGEAFSFMEDVLGVTSPEEKYDASLEVFLQELIVAWYNHIPFQSVSMIATPSDKRHLPTLLEIKRAMFSKKGGVCYVHNVGFYLLLCAVGFDVYLAHSFASPANDHPVIVVRNLTKNGSKHLVDVGGCATFRAIPLDFESESPEYRDSYIIYKFIIPETNVIKRLHLYSSDRHLADAYGSGRVIDGWFHFLTIYYDQPVDISYFAATISKVYTDVSLPEPLPPFLTRPRCYAFPNGRFVCIKEATLLVENEENDVQKTYLKSRNEIHEAFARFFPQFDREEIDTMMDDENVEIDFNKNL